MEGTNGLGASVVGSGANGAPKVSLTTTGPDSLIFTVGNDWDNAIAHKLPNNWTMLDQWTNTNVGDDYWMQYTSDPIPTTGTPVSVGDTAPTTDRWNRVAVEVLDDPS